LLKKRGNANKKLKMWKTALFGIAVILTAAILIPISYFVIWDLGINAEWHNELLIPYGEYADGVKLAIAPHGFKYDIITFVMYQKAYNRTVGRYMGYGMNIIKIDREYEDAISHELGHYYWLTRLNQTQRDEFCEYSDVIFIHCNPSTLSGCPLGESTCLKLNSMSLLISFHNTLTASLS